jgi:hypothetical protein
MSGRASEVRSYVMRWIAREMTDSLISLAARRRIGSRHFSCGTVFGAYRATTFRRRSGIRTIPNGVHASAVYDSIPDRPCIGRRVNSMCSRSGCARLPVEALQTWPEGFLLEVRNPTRGKGSGAACKPGSVLTPGCPCASEDHSSRPTIAGRLEHSHPDTAP